VDFRLQPDHDTPVKKTFFQQKNIFSALPIEVVLNIWTFFDLKTLNLLAQINKEFYNYSNGRDPLFFIPADFTIR
jgi:hypothetical protein